MATLGVRIVRLSRSTRLQSTSLAACSLLSVCTEQVRKAQKVKGSGFLGSMRRKPNELVPSHIVDDQDVSEVCVYIYIYIYISLSLSLSQTHSYALNRVPPPPVVACNHSHPAATPQASLAHSAHFFWFEVVRSVTSHFEPTVSVRRTYVRARACIAR